MPTPAFWRQWHRWIGAPAALFLLFVSITGILLAGTEFFGEDEAVREANRTLVSPVHTDTPVSTWSAPLAAAMTAANAQAPGAPVDKITVEFKGQTPVIAVYLGKPGGGEDRRLIFDAKTGAFRHVDDYVDKPLLNRIHSGEAFGDGGLVGAMLWGLALTALTISGFLLYWRLMTASRPNRTGLRKFFFALAALAVGLGARPTPASAQGKTGSGALTAIGNTSAGTPVMLETRSVKRADGIVTATLRVALQPTIKTAQGEMVLLRSTSMFDCAKQTSAMKERWFYYDAKGTKEARHDVPGKPGFGPAIKGSLPDVALAYLCKPGVK